MPGVELHLRGSERLRPERQQLFAQLQLGPVLRWDVPRFVQHGLQWRELYHHGWEFGQRVLLQQRKLQRDVHRPVLRILRWWIELHADVPGELEQVHPPGRFVPVDLAT